MAFCVLIHSAALVVLCKKTTYRFAFGFVAVMLSGYALITYVAQLVMYSMGNAYKVYAVYAALYVESAALVTACLYYILLGMRSNKGLCIATGVFTFIPPVGAILAVALSFEIRRDTRVQELVFSGYAFTFAALGTFAAKHGSVFADGADSEKLDGMSPSAARAHLKKLKKQARTPQGMYDYAVAVACYAPQSMREAVDYMTKAAKGGHPPALFNMGFYYETGNYVKKDVKKAREFYDRAVSAGDADAQLRLGILSAENGAEKQGFEVFEKRAKGGDKYAEYDLAVCYERGIGVEKNTDKAVEIYTRLACRGLPIAQDRVFAMAGECVNDVGGDGLFRKLTDINALGDFGLAVKGLKEVMKRNAPAAAEHFLRAVKCRARWEGVARCMVGVLYMDSGKLLNDKRNGAAYVKSAFGMTSIAKEIYDTVPKEYKAKKR